MWQRWRVSLRIALGRTPQTTQAPTSPRSVSSDLALCRRQHQQCPGVSSGIMGYLRGVVEGWGEQRGHVGGMGWWAWGNGKMQLPSILLQLVSGPYAIYLSKPSNTTLTVVSFRWHHCDRGNVAAMVC